MTGSRIALTFAAILCGAAAAGAVTRHPGMALAAGLLAAALVLSILRHLLHRETRR